MEIEFNVPFFLTAKQAGRDTKETQIHLPRDFPSFLEHLIRASYPMVDTYRYIMRIAALIDSKLLY